MHNYSFFLIKQITDYIFHLESYFSLWWVAGLLSKTPSSVTAGLRLMANCSFIFYFFILLPWRWLPAILCLIPMKQCNVTLESFQTSYIYATLCPIFIRQCDNATLISLECDNATLISLECDNATLISLGGAATSIILTFQQKFSCDKHIFVVTKRVCRDKTHLLSWQKYACHNKIMFVMTKDMFVATKVSLSLQKFCHHKIIFVMTKKCL